jgi:hypothetical protein
MRSPRFCRTDTPRDAHFAFLSYTPFPHPYLSFISNLPPPASPRPTLPPHPPPCSPGRDINHYVDRTPLGGRAGHGKGDETNGSQGMARNYPQTVCDIIH